MDYAVARRHMVDGQIRPNRVTNPRLLDALLELPRETFLPRAVQSRAYTDEDVPLPGGRAMLEPMVLAKLVQLAAVRPGDRVLVAGAGTGYGAAVLAQLGGRVIAVEADEPLLAIAREALPACLPAGAVRLVAADPTQGFAAGAPYDVVLIEGEVPEIPAALSEQLAEGGRLVGVLGSGRRDGRAVLGQRLCGSFTLTPVFDCAAAPLPAFAKAPGFVF
jgi:protein-L-isoaspartate(D-aspartate) O-methyltransferase